MLTKPLPFDLIRIDAGTQSRLAINEDTVEDYAEIIRAAKQGEWPFPPLDVFHDGSDYFMSSGFHRLLGAQRAGRASAPCHIHKGTAQDAKIFGMTANDSNGLRMSRADKRSCVEWLLDNGGKMPQREIAEKAGVSERLVRTIVQDRKPKVIPQQTPPMATNRQIAAFGTQGGGQEDVAEPVVERSPASKPPKTYDRDFWYRQWNQSIGPLVRLVDKIAHGVGEVNLASHRCILGHLEVATEEMSTWMKVQK